MVPSGGIELVPIDSLWTGSVKSVWEITRNTPEEGFPIWTIICTALAIILLFSKNILPFLSRIKPFDSHSLPQNSQQSTLTATLIYLTVILFSSFIISGALQFLNLSLSLSFSSLFMVTVAFSLLKIALLNIIGIITGTPCIKSFAPLFCLLMAAVSLLLMLFTSVFYIFPAAIGHNYLSIMLIISIASALLIYLYKVSVTLFSTGISPFYSFLYLCTVEIVPLSIFAVMFIRFSI